MFKGNRLVYLASVAVLAIAVVGPVSFAAKTPAAREGDAVYNPIQSMSFIVGSKRASGYFTRGQDRCELTLMVAEAIDAETAPPQSAARLRVALLPGQMAGLDSEEGRSLELTCGPDAETLTVRAREWTSDYQTAQ